MIVGYDVRPKRAIDLLSELDGLPAGVKIDYELLVDAMLDDIPQAGVLLDLVHNHPGTIMLDNKHYDILDRVQRQIEVATRLRVDVVTVHIDGGEAMLRAAVKQAALFAKEFGGPTPQIFGITVLTSLTYPELAQVGKLPKGVTDPVMQDRLITERVYDLAVLAKQFGLQGFVAAPTQLPELKDVLSDRFAAITPGVRSPA